MCYYCFVFFLDMGCELRSIAISMCMSVRSRISKTLRNFCARYLWLWLGLHQMLCTSGFVGDVMGMQINISNHKFPTYSPHVRWLGSRVVSVLDSGAEGPGFKSKSRRCRVTVFGKLFTPIVRLFTKQRNW